MVVFIGGASSTGKSRFAKLALERYHISCLSEDHLKMGLIRGWPDCGFTATSPENLICERLWPVVEGIARTCIENKQDLLIEGCYLPEERLRALLDEYPQDCRALVLVLSESYLDQHFEDGLLRHRCDVEQRLYAEERSRETVKAANRAQKERCERAGVPYVEITEDYEAEMDAAMTRLFQKEADRK